MFLFFGDLKKKKKRAIHKAKTRLGTQDTLHTLLPSQSSCSVSITHLNHSSLFRLPTGLETLQRGTRSGFSFLHSQVREPCGALPPPSQQAAEPRANCFTLNPITRHRIQRFLFHSHSLVPTHTGIHPPHLSANTV